MHDWSLVFRCAWQFDANKKTKYVNMFEQIGIYVNVRYRVSLNVTKKSIFIVLCVHFHKLNFTIVKQTVI